MGLTNRDRAPINVNRAPLAITVLKTLSNQLIVPRELTVKLNLQLTQSVLMVDWVPIRDFNQRTSALTAQQANTASMAKYQGFVAKDSTVTREPNHLKTRLSCVLRDTTARRGHSIQRYVRLAPPQLRLVLREGITACRVRAGSTASSFQA